MSITDPDTLELACIKNPKFEVRYRMHNWCNYVPEEYKTLWSELSLEVRTAIYFMAQEQADKEEWE